MPDDELKIAVNGIPVPASMAAEAVKRCIRGIQITDKLIRQGFASEDDLRLLRSGLTGEDRDENVSDSGAVRQ